MTETIRSSAHLTSASHRVPTASRTIRDAGRSKRVPNRVPSPFRDAGDAGRGPGTHHQKQHLGTRFRDAVRDAIPATKEHR